MRELFLFFFLVVIASKSNAQQAGTLDTTFGVGGKVLLNIPGGWNAIALQSDGKIVVAGGALVVRLNTDGSLDTSFSQDGWDTITNANFLDIAIQVNGKIVVVGNKVVRFNSNGTLDTTFGNGGISTAGFQAGMSIALQPDMKILILTGCMGNNFCGGGEFTCYRLNSDGSIDSSFANNGLFTYNFSNPFESSGASDLALLSDGKIVLVGAEASTDGSCYSDEVIMVLSSNGSIVYMYGGGVLNSDAPYSAALAARGNGDLIVLSAEHYIYPSTSLNYFSRGGINSWGIGSSTSLSSIYEPKNLIIQPDDKLVIVGISANTYDFLLNRSAAYYLDTSFGSNGIVYTDFGNNTSQEEAISLAIQSDWKIIAVGHSLNQLALARYNNCGALCTLVNPCTSICNGSITISSFGVSPFTYQWSSGDTIPIVDSLCAGNYQVIMTDHSGCTSSYTINLTNALNTSISCMPTSCFGICDGNTTAIPVGGTPPYTYLWNNGDTLQTAFNLCAGNYTVFVTDMNNCVDSASIPVFEPQALVTSSSVQNPNCTGCSNGNIAYNISGGIPPYLTSWLPQIGLLSNDSLINLPAGIYTFIITDVNGCSDTFIDTLIDQPDQIQASTFDLDFSIIPNPAHNSFTISFPEGKKSTELEIISLFSQRIYAETDVDCRLLTVDCELFTPGIYFIKLKNEDGASTRKLIIE